MKRLAILAAAVWLAMPVAHSQVPSGPVVARSDTLLTSTVDVYGETKVVAYSVPLNHLTGDKILSAARIQISSTLPYNVMIGFGVLHASTPTDVTGHWIVRATTMNVTPDIHHLPRMGTDWELATRDFTGYANVIVYAAASRAQPGDTIRIDPYGSVSVATYGTGS